MSLTNNRARCLETIIVSLTVSLFYSVAIAIACSEGVLFSSHDDIGLAIHLELQQVQTTAHCSLFGISNLELAADLAVLGQSGKDIRIRLDHRQSALGNDLHEDLEASGVKVAIKPTADIEDNTFCVLDGKAVIVGQWNWSASAQKQDNSNLFFHDCPTLAATYEAAFQRTWQRDWARAEARLLGASEPSGVPSDLAH
jgi:phosphatidylserine/phosphatidylglycerophosphate/cardiolipin synthase-like enzyme